MQDYPPQGTMQGKEVGGTTLRPASEISAAVYLSESSQIVSSQQQESRMSAVGSIEEVSDQQLGIEQHAEGENQGLDLNKTPKPKRKKHRPKVVIEGKPARTPKPATPAPKTPRRPRNSETPPVKRKYVRRKKAVGSSDKVAVKRIYVRRKKAVEPSDKAVGSSDAPWSVSVEVVDQEGGNGRKSVKRSLNFETQDSEAKAREECVAGTTDHSNANSTVYSSDEAWDLAMESSLEGLKFDWNTSMNQLLNEWHSETPTPPHLVRFACNAEAPAHERSVIGTFVSSDTNTTLHSSTQAYCPPARNSLTEMAFDLNCPSNQLPNENVRIPGNPTPPPQPWGQEMMRINQMQLPTRRDEEDFKKHSGKTDHRNNAGTSKTSLKTDSDQLRSNKASDNLLKGIKRHRSYIDEYLNFLRATSSTELRSSGSQQIMASRSPCFSEVHKKKRTENKHNRSTSDAAILTRAPSNCGKLRPMGPTNCEDFTFADAQTFMAGMQASERGSGPMLMFDQVEGQRQNKLNKAHSPTLVGATVDYKQQSDQEKPSDNAGCNQPPTPEKPLGCHVSLRNELHDSQSHSAVKDVSRYTKPRTIRCRKKEQTHTVNVMSSYNYQIHLNELVAASRNGVSSLGKDSIWVNVSASRNSKDKNSRHGIGSVQDCEDSSSNRRSVRASLQHGTIVPYRDPVDDIVHKLRCLNINGHHDVAVQAHNAIVPCDRGGRAMVPYEGPFEFTKRRRPRAKVDLDPESDRVWKLLMGNDRNNGNEGIDLDKEKWWEEERRVFRGRADSFIARMHLIQGDRRFSQWKGSVVDSVIGVFLTQNVSDHLSSSAFMAIAARFPLQSRGKKRTNNAEKISTFTEQPDGCIVDVDDTSISWEKRLGQDLCDQGAFLTHKPVHIEEKVSNEKEIERSHESPDSGSGTTVTVTGSTSVAEGEDRRSVEDAVSSQNSLISSQSSSEYIVHAADNKKLNSIFNVEADDLLDGGVFNDLDSKSFTELLQMAENRKFQELPFPGNERVSSAEYSEIYQLASQRVDKRSSVPVPSNFPNGGSHSIDTSQSHLHPRQHDFTSLTCAPPSYYKHDSPNSRLVGTENANVQREQSISYLPPIPFEINMKTKIKITVKESASVENPTEAKGHQESLLASTTAPPANSCTSINSSVLPSTSSVKEVCVEMHSCRQTTLLQKRIGTSNLYGNTADFHEESEAEFCMKSSQQANKDEAHMQHHTTPEMCLHVNNDESHDKLTTSKVLGSVESRLSDTTCTLEKISAETATNVSQAQRVKAKAEKNQTFDWDSLRRQACSAGTRKERSINTMDSVDWEALRCADVNEVSHTIRERGMNNILAGRIKDFLNRLVREHGSIDLEWLRDIPPDKAKDYLLSIRGLGLKSVECVRLLTLHHLAFPVDTNVGRICVRLGWVPLQPLPESLQLHLLEMYPVLETIQKYLWPRLCKLDQRTLYELHYQMITFGKVFCTKSKPNCNACPMRGECKHFASAFASARLALPGPEEKGLVSSSNPTASEKGHASVSNPIPLPQLEGCELCQDQNLPRNCEPIIEEPATPEPECMETCESAIEDAFYEDPDEIPTIKLNLEEFTQNLQNYMQENNMEIQDGDLSKALVAITPEAASIPMPKLKNVSRLRTEHQVYELPDSHPLLEGLDKREPDDPCPYLLAIWTPGETAQSIEPPKVYCNSQDTGKLCDKNTCFSCNSIREAQAQTVRGTLLIPCRTAMRGSFPLNGTYFQVNEVFADHDSSRNPIEVPRDWIWNLARRTVCFGTSVPTIFRGLSTEGIQHCFWRGFICVRGFDRTSRAPRPLYARLHFPASKVTRNKKTTTATKEEE